MKQRSKLQQLTLIVTLSRDRKCQQPLPCRLLEAKQSFPLYKEEEILLLPHKSPKQVIHNTCKHYRLFRCLSHSVNYVTIRHFQALPRHVYSNSMTLYEAG